MIMRYVCIVTQQVCALALFVLCFMVLHDNHLGQNIINFTAAIMLSLRLENIIAFYRLYINSSCLESYATIVTLTLFSLGKLIENYSPTVSTSRSKYLNQFCTIFLILILSINLLYYFISLLTLVFYIVKQLYKLAMGTILSSSATLLQQQLQILRRSFKPYEQLSQNAVILNNECPICLGSFEPEQQCIVLPGCQHCFHQQCIDQWLNSKSNCPYCRNNIRLGLMRNQ